jgi:GTP-binding protein
MLGIAAGPGDTSFVLADIPGLIEGAHLGKGLGDKFLKHVERTRALLHLVDCGELAAMPPAEALAVVRSELASYSPALAARPSIVVATKVEDDASAARAADLARQSGLTVHAISAATGRGVRELVAAVTSLLATLQPPSVV